MYVVNLGVPAIMVAEGIRQACWQQLQQLRLGPSIMASGAAWLEASGEAAHDQA